MRGGGAQESHTASLCVNRHPLEHDAKDSRRFGEIGGGPKGDGLTLGYAVPGVKQRQPTAPAEGLILMDAGRVGLDLQEDERSLARAKTALGATVQSRMARASVARVMERAMTLENISA